MPASELAAGRLSPRVPFGRNRPAPISTLKIALRQGAGRRPRRRPPSREFTRRHSWQLMMNGVRFPKLSMIELPRALQPWAQELELFPSETASALAPLLPRLDRLVGPLRASPKWGRGEPDGFDGLSRRGIYDRLLVSEWLLADEAPLEFARRAATGEHAFLKLAQREPQSAPLSLAVFDAGPNQLGAPRLLHLAALVVLFRRAKNSGAYFRWGVLQQTGNRAARDIE